MSRNHASFVLLSKFESQTLEIAVRRVALGSGLGGIRNNIFPGHIPARIWCLCSEALCRTLLRQNKSKEVGNVFFSAFSTRLVHTVAVVS